MLSDNLCSNGTSISLPWVLQREGNIVFTDEEKIMQCRSRKHLVDNIVANDYPAARKVRKLMK